MAFKDNLSYATPYLKNKINNKKRVRVSLSISSKQLLIGVLLNTLGRIYNKSLLLFFFSRIEPRVLACWTEAVPELPFPVQVFLPSNTKSPCYDLAVIAYFLGQIFLSSLECCTQVIMASTNTDSLVSLFSISIPYTSFYFFLSFARTHSIVLKTHQ